MQKSLRFFLVLILLASVFASLLAGVSNPVQAGTVAAGYSEYFIPGAIDQLFGILRKIDNLPSLGNADLGVDLNVTPLGTCADHMDPDGGGNGLAGCNELRNITTVSVATDNVTVYYDHWENGYGTGASGDEVYTANKGDILTFESSFINVRHSSTKAASDCASRNAKRNSTVLGTGANCYDGRDRLYVVGSAVSVAQAFWPEALGTVYANAWEIYPVKPEQTEYIIPVGVDLAAAPYNYLDFTSVFVLVEGTNDGTTVQIDDPTIAGIEVNKVLNRGDYTQLGNVHTGTKVTSSKPAQVQFIVGKSWADVYSESRSYTAVPSGLWSHEYFNPVRSGTAAITTDLYIYNPHTADLKVNYQDGTASGTITIPALSTRSFTRLAGHIIPTNSGVYLVAADGSTNFWVIGSYDTESADYNYGFTLIPGYLLTDEYYISWSPGSTNLSANGSPVYVTPTQNNTTLYVDFSPIDGMPNATYTMNRGQTQTLVDPDNDNTGMHVWANGPISLVWGQDSTRASNGNPYIDAGYTILPLHKEWIDVVQETVKLASPSQVLAIPNQLVTFTLRTASSVLLDRVDVRDDLPAGWSYVAGSAVITQPGGSTANVEPSVAGQTLTWSDVTAGNIAANQLVTITFQARSPNTMTPGDVFNVGTATATVGDDEFTSTASALVEVLPRVDLTATKTHLNTRGSDWIYSGDEFDWSIQVKNAGTQDTANLATGSMIFRDNLPAGPTYSNLTTTLDSGVTGPVRCQLLGTGPYRIECDANGGAVSLPPGQSFTVRVRATSQASVMGLLVNPAPGGTNVCMADPNGVMVEDDETNNTCADSVTVYARPNLTVAKTSSTGGQGAPGLPFTWNLTVQNAPNTSAATFTNGQVILIDNLPAGPAYGPVTVSSTAVTGPLRCQIAAGALTCDADGAAVTIPSGESFTASFSVTPATAGSLVNPAAGAGNRCQVNPNNNVVESATADNGCAETVNVQLRPDLQVAKTSSVGGSVTLPSGFNWILTVSNQGDAPATFTAGQVFLRDSLPTVATYGNTVAVTTAGGMAATNLRCQRLGTGPYSIECDASGGPVTIPVGGSFTATIGVSGLSAGTISNPAAGGECRVDPSSLVFEKDENNNTCASTVNVFPSMDLTAAKTAGSLLYGNAVLNRPFNWNIRVQNTGSTGTATFGAGQTVLIDNLPAGAAYDSVTVTPTGLGGTGTLNCTLGGTTLTCTANGGTVTFPPEASADVRWRVTPSATGTLTNPAAGGANRCAVDPANVVPAEADETTNNNCSNSVTVVAKPDLTLTKTSDNSMPLAGSSFHWTLTVRNAAPAAAGTDPGAGAATFNAGDLVFSDVLPAGASYQPTVDLSYSPGWSGALSCAISGASTLTCSAAAPIAIPPQEYANVVVTVTPAAPGALTNAAAGCQLDPNARVDEANEGNNTCSNTVTVQPKPDLSVTKTGSVASLTLPGSFNWVLTVSNAAGVTPASFSTSQVLLVDTLPNGPAYGAVTVSRLGGTTGNIVCGIVTNVLTCTASGPVTLPAGGSYTVTLPVTPTVPGSLVNPTGGVCRSDPNNAIDESNESNNDAAHTVQVLAPPDLSATKTNTTAGVYVLGDPAFNWQINVRNASGSAAATFASGQFLLRDDLPAGPTYGNTITVTTTGGMAATNLRCQRLGAGPFRIECDANGGAVSVPAGGSFTATISVTPTSAGSLANPAGTGICRADPANILTGEASETDNYCSDTVNVLQRVTMGDKVWLDQNANGVQDAGETAGVTGATVALRACGANGTCGDGDDVTVATQVTPAGGAFSFSAAPGTYYLQVTPPAGYFHSPTGQGTAATDSNPNPATGQTASFTLASGAVDNTLDAGLYQRASLGDRVWTDMDANGIQNMEATGLDGVPVTLKTCGANGTCDDSDDVTIGTTNSAGGGLYSFTGLTPGDYYLTFTAPANSYFSPSGLGTPVNNSDPNPSTGKTGRITLTSGQANNDVDAGIYQPGVIGDRVWFDRNFNGVQDTGETGLGGVPVTLFNCGVDALCYNGDDANLGDRVTAGDGAFAFTDVRPGRYYLSFTAPLSYVFSPRVDGIPLTDSNIYPATGRMDFFVISSGQTDNSIDAGLYQNNTVSGRVWNDANGNGGINATEPGISPVTVQLYNGTTLIASTTSAADGSYAFANVQGGSYRIVVTPPAGYRQTGDPDTILNNETVITVTTASIAGQNFGYQAVYTVSGTIWNDADGDGTREVSENGLTPVTVRLFEGTTEIATTTSATNGSYSFANVPAGNYQVRVDPPSGYRQTGDPDAVRNNQTDLTVTNANVTDKDFGYQAVYTISGTIWNDADGDGNYDATETGLSPVTVRLFEGTTEVASTTSAANGTYTFANVPNGDYRIVVTPPAGYNQTGDPDATINNQTDITVSGANVPLQNFGYQQVYEVSGTIWNDANGDGTFVGSETGLSPVTVRLFEGATEIDTTTSAADGSYRFTNVPAGNYEVRVDPPAGHRQTGDPDTTLDNRTDVSVTNADVTDKDFGYQAVYTVNGTIWNDSDGDGTFDGTETGLTPVTVRLMSGTTEIASTTSDANGSYSFPNVPNGDFRIVVTPPAGYRQTGDPDAVRNNQTDITVANANVPGKNFGYQAVYTVSGTIWNDADGDGNFEGTENGLTPVTVRLFEGATEIATATSAANGSYSFANVPAGNYQVRVDPPSGYRQTGDPDTTLDNRTNVAVTNANVTDRNFGYQPVYTVSGTIWNDSDGDGNYDAAENGIDAVTVRLYEGTTEITSTTSATNGSYSFANVPNGAYQIIVTPPPGYQQTGDPDAVRNNQTDITVANANVPGKNFGYQAVYTVSGTIWNDADGDGTFEGTETGLTPVIVRLMSGTTEIASTTSDANGSYSFANVPAGNYQVRVDPPSGYRQTGDPDAVRNNQTDITVANANVTDQDFGYQAVYTVSGTIWNDADGNGNYDATETGLSPVTVRLFEGTTEVASTTSAANGTYTFANVPNGDYRIVVTPPAGYNQTGDPDATINNQTDITVSGANVPIQNFGYQQVYEVSGTIWNDANGDGTFNGSETGLSPVTVRLFEGITEIDSTTSSASGDYSFTSVPAGNYEVRVDPPAGHRQTGDPDTTLDNRTDVSVTNADVTDKDFGYQRVYTVSGTIWNDADGDGIFDGTETGLAPVTVQLYSGTTWIASTSVVNGRYSFPNVPNGDYSIVVTPPPGYRQIVDPDAVVNDQTSFTVNNANVPDLNFSYQALYTISGTIWNDADGDGTFNATETGLSPATVRLFEGTTEIATSTSATNGSYTFANVPNGDYRIVVTPPPGYQQTGDPDTVLNNQTDITVANATVTDQDFGYQPVYSVSGTIWRDTDGDGTFDGAETGLSPVTVRLYEGTIEIASTTSLADGSYSFLNVPAGDYQVRVDAPVGYQQTGDPDATRDNRTNIAVTNANITDRDFGYQAVYTVSGSIWNDANGDGAFDVTETGITPVTVRLFEGTTEIATTTSAADGSYAFANLPNGDYRIVVTPPAGYNQTGDPDAILNNETDITVADMDIKALDFGYQVVVAPRADLSIHKTDGVTAYVPGGTLTYTITVTNGGTMDVTGAVITDTRPAGILRWTWTCATPANATCQGMAQSSASFTDTVNLGPSETIRYTVTAVTDPAARSNLVNRATVTLPPSIIDPDPGNNTSTDTDTPAPQAELTLTKVANLDRFTPGTTLSYTLTVTNAGQSSAEGVRVEDSLPAQLSYVEASPAPAGQSPLQWNLGTLRPGQSVAITLVVMVQDGASEDITNTAATSTTTEEGNPNNNSSSFTCSPEAPTPVELVYFRAVPLWGDRVGVQWATETEVDTFGYRLMRSTDTDLAHAVEVAYLPVNRETKTYSFVDTVPGPGRWHYWLVKVNTNGTEESEGPIWVEPLRSTAQPKQIYLPLLSR